MNRILYIVVIYRISSMQSAAIRSLRSLLGEERFASQVYIHDNTPNNVGLSGAYNAGLAFAKEHIFDWLVLMDADMHVTQTYLDSVDNAIANGTYPVYIPTLINLEGVVLSPNRHYGIPTAFNSGMVIRRTLIEDIGGWDNRYPLDYLDYWFCSRLAEKNISWGLLDVKLKHELSIMNYDNVSQDRYLSILRAERLFADDTHNTLRYKFNLLMRAIKWTLTGHRYIRETWKALLQ